MNGDGIKARRHAREIVYDLHWRGITVPPLYARMDGEFQDLVRSGDYAAWVAAKQTTARTSGWPRDGGAPTLVQPIRHGAPRAIHRTQPAPVGGPARPRHLLPGPLPGW
jgi:hypothetical protein